MRRENRERKPNLFFPHGSQRFSDIAAMALKCFMA
jgi:hypothetical protein